MPKNIILTTGIYDMIKDHVRRKKVTIQEEELLLAELRGAKQVRRKDLPNDVVTVNRKVTIMNHTDNKVEDYIFVSTDKKKEKKGKFSILSAPAIATVGRKVGDKFDWPFKTGTKNIEILKVELFQQA